jgi:hypothetical protein
MGIKSVAKQNCIGQKVNGIFTSEKAANGSITN